MGDGVTLTSEELKKLKVREGVDTVSLTDIEKTKYHITRNNDYISFNTKIQKLMEFLDSLTMLIFWKGDVKTCISGTKVHMLQTDLIDSTVKTLNSINYCSMFGSFSDANVLVRKFRDDLLLFLYIIETLNNRRYLTDDQINEIVGDGMDADKFLKVVEFSLNIAVDGCTKNDDDKSVDAWFDDSVHNLSKKQKRKLYFENYMIYLKTNVSVDEVIKKYNLENNWEDIRKKLNDYTHNNGRYYTQHNLMSINSPDIKNNFEEIISRLDFITAFFLVLLILIDPIMIGSTDYIDCLDCSLTPPEDSQYQIAPFVQEFIDEYINKLNPDLKLFLKNNNKYGMLID